MALIGRVTGEGLTELKVVEVAAAVTMETVLCVDVGGGVSGGLSGIVIGVSLDVVEVVLTMAVEWESGMGIGTKTAGSGRDDVDWSSFDSKIITGASSSNLKLRNEYGEMMRRN